MNKLKCPYCNHEFEVEDYSCGDCPNCGKSYHWGDDWNYLTLESMNPDFYAINKS